MKERTLKIIYVALSEIKVNPNNSKVHDQTQIRELADGMNQFGVMTPIGLDKSKTLIYGEGRYLAAKLAGLKSYPCIIFKDLSEAEKRAYIIADNKLAEGSRWDFDKLSTELGYLIEQEFDTNFTGFDGAEIEKMLTGDFDFLPPTPVKKTFVAPHYRASPGESTTQAKAKEPGPTLFKLVVFLDTEEERNELADELRERELTVKI